ADKKEAIEMAINAGIDMAIMFGRIVLPQSYVISVVITMLFAVIVNQVMKRKLRAIPMVESLKSVE
ncbi:hypothetical protein, partial [Holdemania massiliensis]|uniref:hypothetical protein n=1 Tax=Holdemania massiliensis TaxID=1468449 RepID=UPI002431265B